MPTQQPVPAPLRSTRRMDGLWESIEKDDDHPATDQVIVVSTTRTGESKLLEAPSPGPNIFPRHSMTSIGTQTSFRTTTPSTDSPPHSILTATPSNSMLRPVDGMKAIPKTLDLTTPVLSSPLPHSDINKLAEPAANQSPPLRGATRRRCRPKKATGFRNVRSMRFSDPSLAAEPEHASAARDTHVFVRLLKVLVEPGAVPAGEATPTTAGLSFVWNNRGKGWKTPHRKEDEGFVDLLGLFERPWHAGVVVRPIVLPTEGGGVRQSVEMGWDVERSCFLGLNQDGKTLSVTLGEMKDMAKDPWARQFVGYMVA